MLSIQDQVLNLIVHKGMTEADAVAEIEVVLHATLPLNIRESIRDCVDMYYYHQSRQYGGGVKDLSNTCYWCALPLSDEYYFYGCGFWICSEHDQTQPVGQHRPIDHLTSPTQRGKIDKGG